MLSEALARTEAETRASLEDPRVSLSDPNVLQLIFGEAVETAGESVNESSALKVPAIWAAVNFLSSTIASLPLKVYVERNDSREVDRRNRWHRRLNNAPNTEWNSFRWRKYTMLRTLLAGRSYTWVERSTGMLWPLRPSMVKPKLTNGRLTYEYKENENRAGQVYPADEIIDLSFMFDEDPAKTVSPVSKLSTTIGLSIALQTYAARHFKNGGLPPTALVGPGMSPSAAKRAGDDIKKAISNAVKSGSVPAIPEGYELKALGIDPEKSQLEQARRFQIEEVARIYDLPPVFLQDLTHGTFSNTEQQDLHFVKHTLTQWIRAWEQELNQKLFRHGQPRADTSHYVKFSVDGLLRGDFKTRMEGLAKGVQNALLTPNEARATDDRPPMEGGDRLHLQQNMSQLDMLDQDGNPMGGEGDAGPDSEQGE